MPDEPPSVAGFLAFDPGPVPLLPVVGLVLAIAYLCGFARLRMTGRAWPIPRALAFLAGCAILVAVTVTATEGYGHVLISVFMFQQLTLMMIVPPLLVFGSPGTMLLTATPHSGVGGWIQRGALTALRSRGGRVLINPGLTIPLFLLAFYGLYLAGVAEVVLAIDGGHLALEVFFLASGILFAIPVLSADPLPRKHSALGRLVEMSVKTALHTAFGITLMLATTPLVAAFTRAPERWAIDPLYDQAVAGALVWTYAELPSFVILIYLLNRWFRDSTRRDRAADRAADSAGDPDLAAYNDYLASLNRQATRPTATPGE
jgi:putative membrane protein